MGKVHGSLARAGKVKNATPKVAKQEKKKKLVGRPYKRYLFNKRYAALKKGQSALRVKLNSVQLQQERKQFKEAQAAALAEKKANKQ